MKQVFLFSALLVLGLALSQVLPEILPEAGGWLHEAVQLLTMACLSFIMIHVGYEFEIDRKNLRAYAVDYGVAATAAGFPWIFCALYFVFVLGDPSEWSSFSAWKEALLGARFAAPTSAGILFSMLAAAGLSATWVFRKARILAIFDDLDTVLLLIPLKMLMVGARWQLAFIVLVMVVLLGIAWKYLHALRLPVTWPWVMGYASAIAAASEAIYRMSKLIDDVVPVHIEVLLPAFVLGCVLARPEGQDPHADDAREGHQEGPSSGSEQRVATWISAAFMVLVGLSMPPLLGAASAPGDSGGPGWGAIALHTAAITILANLGKMFPLFCYRGEAHWKERLALCLGMFPRGEVGAGIIVLSLSYGLDRTLVTVCVLALALNLVLTGLFIYWAKVLISGARAPRASSLMKS